MAKLKEKLTLDPERGPLLTPRFIIGLVLMLAGIGFVVYVGAGVLLEGTVNDEGALVEQDLPTWILDLGRWSYAIGFGALMLGLIVSAHPSTPLGRGRGVVVAMLACFIIGLIWICVYYAIAQDTSVLPVFDDLEQSNLIVGIAFMAVGFTFATRWE